MIARVMAVRHPSRVRTMKSISSTPSWRIGRERLRTTTRLVIANPAVLTRRRVRTADQAAERLVRAYRVIGSPGYPLDEVWLREVALRMHERGGPAPAREIRALADRAGEPD